MGSSVSSTSDTITNRVLPGAASSQYTPSGITAVSCASATSLAMSALSMSELSLIAADLESFGRDELFQLRPHAAPMLDDRLYEVMRGGRFAPHLSGALAGRP